MVQTVAVVNQKGGVGKTASTLNLASSLAVDHNERVLMIDADPQGNLTTGAGLTRGMPKSTEPSTVLAERKVMPLHAVLEHLVSHAELPDLSRFLLPTATKNVFMLPVDLQLPLWLRGQPTSLLRDFLDLLPTSFGHVFIDCPPSQSEIHNNALAAASWVLIPCSYDSDAARGALKAISVAKACEQLRLRREDREFEDFYRVAFTIAPAAKKRSRDDALEILGEVATRSLFENVIRQDDKIAQARTVGLSIFHYAPNSNGAVDYENLTKEILGYERKEEKTIESNGQRRPVSA